MDSDMVMEVPDTPERTSISRSFGESSSRIYEIDDKPSSSNQCLEPMARTYSRQAKNFGPNGFNRDGVTRVDDDFLFSQARIARTISDNPDSRKTHLSISSGKPEQSGVLNDDNGMKTNPQTIVLSDDSPVRYKSSRSKEESHRRWQTERNRIIGYHRLGVRSLTCMEGLRKERGNAVNNLKDFVGTSNTNEVENVKCRQLNSRATDEQSQSRRSEVGFQQGDVFKNQDIKIGDGSGKDSESITRRADVRHQGLVLYPKNNGHRRLVRNGCISPSNIERNKNDGKARGIEEGSVISNKIPNFNSSQSVDQGRTVDKGKGKEVMNDEFLASSQHDVARPPYRRSCLMPEKEVTISDLDYDTGRIQIDGFEASHKKLKSSSFLSSSHAALIPESENMSRHLSSSSGEIGGSKCSPSVGFKTEETTLQSRRQGCFKLDSEAPQLTGKRKINLTHSNAGECSSSTVDRPRMSYDRTSLKPLYPRSTRSRKSVRVDTGLAPIVEIDELDDNTQGENHELSDEFIARSLQLESDEVLARQLQEQFYLETPPVGATEREVLLPALVGRPRFYHSSTRLTARARTGNRTGRIRRNISSPSMSLDERMDFFEALEAAFEYGNGTETPGHFLDVQRDFNENDYEMLLALDENNHHVGASERQINSLPQSLFQSTDSEEACVICLETPLVGDTIRHLPCLHRFHKECIDTWLKRKRSCPICKSGIS